MFGFFKKDKYEQEAQAAMERRARQAAPGLAARIGSESGKGGAAAASRPVRQSSDAARSAVPSARQDESSDSREQAIRRMQAQVAPMMSPERQALLKNAMAVHRAKQKILDDLDDESRAKLVAMAITTLLHQIEPDAGKPRKK